MIVKGHGVFIRLVECLLVSASVLATNSADAQLDARSPSQVLMEVETRPGPPGWLRKGMFANGPGCVSAKLDVWFERGSHVQQLFMPDATADDARQEPAIQVMTDGDMTTIFVGRSGCRFRIRIDKAE